MTVKLSQEIVDELFAAKGFILLDWYSGHKTPMRCLCPSCNSVCEKSIGALKQTYRGGCIKCRGVSVSKAQRLEQNTVEKEYTDKGFMVIPGQIYVNNDTPLFCTCPNCGRTHPKSLSSLRQTTKNGCVYCKGELVTRSNTHTIAYVKQYFTINRCTFLSDVYKNSHVVYDYICECGREAKINFLNFSHGKRCRGCQSDNSKGEKNPFWRSDRERMALEQSIAKRVRKSLRKILDSIGRHKDARTEEILGYTVQDLIEHLSQHPNWKVVEDTKWHIDHIFPIKAFLDHNIQDPRIINGLDNLQPLSVKMNLAKGSRYNQSEFRKYLISKGINATTLSFL